MRVESRPLDDLIHASEGARTAAAHAIARSEAMVPRIAEARERALVRLMASRAHQAFFKLHGVVEGEEVAAVVRNDGSVVVSPKLLLRAKLLVAMGEQFDDHRIEAALGGDLLATALTLIRACDRAVAVELPVLETRIFGGIVTNLRN